MEVFAKYLAGIDHPDHRERTKEILSWVANKYPHLVPEMKWNTPMFSDHGTFIIGFSTAKQHLSVSPEEVVISRFADDIKQAGYSFTKGLFRIPWKDPVHYELLEKMIEFNIEDKADYTNFWREQEDSSMMRNKKLNPKVDEFLSNVTQWKEEFVKLREIVLDCALTEDFKWMHPCYTYEKKNIVLIHGFKEYCALLFHKGSLLKDPNGILIQQTENVQSARQLRFTNIQEIIELESVIKAYIDEAIEVEKAGLEVQFKKKEDYSIPEELQNKFTEIPDLKTAFEALTPGRQKAYIYHFSQPKQSKTRESRIEKSMERIFKGKGLNDCICGLSQKMPNCDGSHKTIR